jgi:hypothetical protein
MKLKKIIGEIIAQKSFKKTTQCAIIWQQNHFISDGIQLKLIAIRINLLFCNYFQNEI